MFIKIEGNYISSDDISRVVIRKNKVRAITEEWSKFSHVNDIRKELHSNHGIDVLEVTFEVVLKSDTTIRYKNILYFDSHTSSERKLYDEGFSLINNYKSDIYSVEKMMKLVDDDFKLKDFGRII